MLDWLYTGIALVMKFWHSLLSRGLDPAAGITWALSIALLVVTVRLILFPLFVKQIKSQRAMQELQPDLQKLRKQYGSDRQGMALAQQALFKERGVNPLAGCLPILPQIPVFLSLFHVLRRLAPGKEGLYSWDDTLTDQAAKAELFGAPISSSFNMDGAKEQAILALPGVSYGGIRTVALTLIVVMCITTFVTQKQIMRRSGPVEGQAAMIQKLLLYGMPLSLFVTGFFFPIGVLLYWTTNNLWTLGQQFFILRKLPPPGSDAAKAKAAADKPAIDPRTLAPKPGAKPVRAKGPRPGTSGPPPAPATETGPDGAGGSPPAGAMPTGSSASGVGSPGGDASSNGSGPVNGSGRSTSRGRSPGGKSGSGPANRAKRKRR